MTQKGKCKLDQSDQRIHDEDESVLIVAIAQMGEEKATQAVEEQEI